MLHKTSDYMQGRFLSSMEKWKFFKSYRRYHEKYLQLFKKPKEIKPAQRNDLDKLPEEYAMKCVARSIKNLPDKFWTSIELHELYKKDRGEENKRSRFLTKLIAHMKNELHVFTSLDWLALSCLKKKRP